MLGVWFSTRYYSVLSVLDDGRSTNYCTRSSTNSDVVAGVTKIIGASPISSQNLYPSFWRSARDNGLPLNKMMQL